MLRSPRVNLQDRPKVQGSTHAIPIRIMHWVGAAAIFCMMASGFEIYNASPILPFVIPDWLTLGGWLGGGIAWHLSAMWVLLADGLCYVTYGLTTGHFRREMLPVGPGSVARDLVAAFRFRLLHRLGHYNAIQRTLYLGVIAVAALTMLTGLSIWKPVQFGWLTDVFGGYPSARIIHFAMMSLILGFVIIHVALVALFPRTLVSMTVGARADEAVEAEP
jgi:thiosulfate reductase cytochrome b subunit